MAGNGQRGTVLLPRAEAFKGKPSGRITQPGLADLRGKRIAFIDDSRPNADVILAEFQSLMESRYGIHAVVVRKKSLGLRINQPLPKDVFEPLAAEVDAGLVALGS